MFPPRLLGRLGSRHPIEFALLLGLAFFLPLFEAPKNLLWAAWMTAWLINRLRRRDWGGPWEYWDTLLVVWIGSGFLVAAFAGTHRNEWDGALDLVRYGSVVFLLRRGGYSAVECRWLAGTLLLSCIIGLGGGAWRHYVTHARAFLELHSVGHVNHSAPYVAMCFALAASWLVMAWQDLAPRARAWLGLATVALLVGLVATSSRSANFAAMAVPAILVAATWRRSRRLSIVVIGVFLGVLATAVAIDAAVVKKQQTFSSSADVTNGRITIWRRALVGWHEYPWFGVGIDNFSQISDSMVEAHVVARGGTYRPDDYRGSSHAHSLYFNTLAERGIVGSGVFVLALASWGIALLRKPPPLAQPRDQAFWWAASASCLGIIVVAGIGNNSFHHELAILAMVVLGIWLSLSRQPAGYSPPPSAL